MKYFTVGHNQIKISYIGLGALHFGVFCDLKRTKNLIDYSIDHGINFIDTAPLYGNGKSELYIKKAIKKVRNKIIIATKFGLKKVLRKGKFGVEVIKLNKKNLEKSLNESLLKMKLDHIDIFQLHAFDRRTDIYETFEALIDFQKKGKILEIGTSNYNPDEMEIAQKAAKKLNLKIATTQLHYNLIERKAEHRLLKQCHEYKIHPISYRALARGILTGKYKDIEKIPKNTRAFKSNRVKKWLNKNLIKLIIDLDKIARSINISMTELALAWQFNNKIKCSTIVGARNIKQLDTIIKSSDVKLNKDIYYKIEECIKLNNFSNYTNIMPEVFFEK
jgi:aryl-alcohol dehydrogenase-like predicted oxidoreductase